MLHTALVRRPFANVFNQHIHSCNHLTSILAKMEATEAGADEVFWLVTMGEIAPVIRIDGTTFGDGKCGLLTALLTRLCAGVTVTRESFRIEAD